jgi:DNA-binding Xre family transcriptional regulator
MSTLSIKKSKENNIGNEKLDESTLPNVPVKDVTEYIKLDDLISEKRAEIKELVDEKIQYENSILKYFERTNASKIKLPEGEIICKKQISKAPIKEDIIGKAITNKLEKPTTITDGGSKLAQDIIDEMNNLRSVITKNNIKRIKKRKSTKKTP